MLKWMISEGYGDARTIERRVARMQQWIDDGCQLMERDEDAEYAAVIEINMSDIKEPILCAPNDPDDARLLSECCDGWEAEHMEVRRNYYYFFFEFVVVSLLLSACI